MREVLSISVRPPPYPSTAQHTSVASCKRRTGARPGSAKFLWFEAKSVALRTRGPMQRSALCSRPVSPLQAHHAPCGCVATAQCCGALVACPASLASRGEAREGHARTHVGFKWGPCASSGTSARQGEGTWWPPRTARVPNRMCGGSALGPCCLAGLRTGIWRGVFACPPKIMQRPTRRAPPNSTNARGRQPARILRTPGALHRRVMERFRRRS